MPHCQSSCLGAKKGSREVNIKDPAQKQNKKNRRKKKKEKEKKKKKRY
jgi:hypothetical protein